MFTCGNGNSIPGCIIPGPMGGPIMPGGPIGNMPGGPLKPSMRHRCDDFISRSKLQTNKQERIFNYDHLIILIGTIMLSVDKSKDSDVFE
jgi:hypothetical protein